MEAKDIKVSIIIPVYNIAPYIGDCLQSVMRQTYKGEMECLLVDDCGEDDSMVIAERMIREYNEGRSKKEEGRSKKDDNVRGRIRFRILRHEVNRGLSAARNTGISHATGDYLYFIDSDDVIEPDCIALLMMKVEENPEVEMVIGNHDQTEDNERGRPYLKDSVPAYVASNEEIVSLFHNQSIPVFAWNKLMKRSFIEEHQIYFKEGIVYEDNLWMFNVMKHLSSLAVLNEVTYHYLKRPDSITTRHDVYRKVDSFKCIYSEILSNLTPGRENKELEHYVARFCKYYLNFKSTIPAYRDLHHLYIERSKQYDCWQVYLILITIRVVGHFGNPSGILEWLYQLWWKWKRFANKK